MQTRPLARLDGVAVERLDEHVVLYDAITQQAHDLNPTAAGVWEAADGTRTVGEIAEQLGIETAAATGALDQLDARGLLVHESGVSRRRMLKRSAAVGAAAVAAAPLVETVLIPTASAHASTGPPHPPTPPTTTYVGANVLVTLPHDGDGSYSVTGTAGTHTGSLPQGKVLFVDYQGNAFVDYAIYSNYADHAGVIAYGFLNNQGDQQATIYNDSSYAVLYSYQVGTSPPVSGTLPANPNHGNENVGDIHIPSGQQLKATLQFEP